MTLQINLVLLHDRLVGLVEQPAFVPPELIGQCEHRLVDGHGWCGAAAHDGAGDGDGDGQRLGHPHLHHLGTLLGGLDLAEHRASQLLGQAGGLDLVVVAHLALQDGLQVLCGPLDLSKMPVGERSAVQRLAIIGHHPQHLVARADADSPVASLNRRRGRVLAHLHVHLVEHRLVLRVGGLVQLEPDTSLHVHLESFPVHPLPKLVVAVDAQLRARLDDREHLRRRQHPPLLLGRPLDLLLST
mmetsp:Transcript_34545/g.73730  ORF Transcript_34545/g.73730 Transcript_34545/m.73730 type:complete len:243 (-) Transcript_34545:488-1216(-)